jgi:hypothetical protein
VQTIHKQALVAFLSMLAFCAQLASYLAFYLLLLLVCPLGAKGLASNCAEIDACLFMSLFLSLACFFTFYLTFFADAKQARDRKGVAKQNQQRR